MNHLLTKVGDYLNNYVAIKIRLINYNEFITGTKNVEMMGSFATKYDAERVIVRDIINRMNRDVDKNSAEFIELHFTYLCDVGKFELVLSKFREEQDIMEGTKYGYQILMLR